MTDIGAIDHRFTMYQPSAPWRLPSANRPSSFAAMHADVAGDQVPTTAQEGKPMSRPRKRCAHSHQKIAELIEARPFELVPGIF